MDIRPPQPLRGRPDNDQPENGEAQPRPIRVGHRPFMPEPEIMNRPLTPHRDKVIKPPDFIPRTADSPSAVPPFSPPVTNMNPPMPPPTSPASTSAEGSSGPPAIVEGEPLQSPPFPASAPRSTMSSTHHGADSVEIAKAQMPPGENATVVGDMSPLSLPADHAHPKKPSGVWLVTGAVLFLIGLYLLLDAQIINNNLNLPVHIFEQTEPPVYTSS